MKQFGDLYYRIIRPPSEIKTGIISSTERYFQKKFKAVSIPNTDSEDEVGQVVLSDPLWSRVIGSMACKFAWTLLVSDWFLCKTSISHPWSPAEISCSRLTVFCIWTSRLFFSWYKELVVVYYQLCNAKLTDQNMFPEWLQVECYNKLQPVLQTKSKKIPEILCRGNSRKLSTALQEGFHPMARL